MDNKPITILRIQSRICIGGPAIHTEILSKHLPADRYRTVLLGGAVDDGEQSKFEELQNQNIDIRIIDEMQRMTTPLNDLKAVWSIYKIIKQENPTIVHTHTAKAGTVGRLAAFMARVPIVIHTFHGHTFDGYFSKPVTFIFKMIERVLGLFSTRIIAISPKQQYDLTKKYRITSEKKVRVIRLGFELERFNDVAKKDEWRKELGIAENEHLLGIVGRLVPIKNIAMSIRVLKHLNEKEKRYHLSIVGDGPERGTLERLTEHLGIQDYVHFMGWKTQVNEIYGNIDALMLTSINEGTPVAIVEAMASGVPVIATNVGGVGDLVEHERNGLLCPSHDEPAMVAFISTLFAQQDVHETLIKNARAFAFSVYGYKRLVNDIDKLYQAECERIDLA